MAYDRVMNIEGMVSALAGGMLIGVSATVLMASQGRIAGISGMVSGLFVDSVRQRLNRLLFLVGLVVGPLLLRAFGVEVNFVDRATPISVVISAGLLVGFGTRFGSGCTSGHGVCGLARLSPRSLVAVAAFLLSGMATVYVMRHILGA